MISWLITAIIDMVATAVVIALEAITGVFTSLMGLSTEGKTLQTMAEIFPQAEEIYPVFLAGGFFICFTIAVFQLCKSMFGPLSEAESPVQLMVRTVFYTALIGLAIPICNGIIYIGAVPYEVMEDYFKPLNAIENNMSDNISFANIFSRLTVEGSADADAAYIANTKAMVDAIAAVPGLFAFLVIIMFLQLMKKYCALLIEIVERYVVLGFLTLIAPLCIATGASRATNFVFKSWLQMMISQVIIIFFSSFFLHTFNYAFGNWIHSFTGTVITDSGAAGFLAAANNPFIYFFFLLAWLTVAAHVDEYMGQLGLTAAKTGGGMGADFMNNVGRSAGIANAATNKILGTNYGKAGGFKNPLHEAMAGKAARAAHKAAGNNTGIRNLSTGLKAAAAKPGFLKAAKNAKAQGAGIGGQLKAGIQGSKTAGFASVNKAHAGEEFVTRGGAKAALDNMMKGSVKSSSDNLGDLAKQAMGGDKGALAGCTMDNNKCYAGNGIAHLEGKDKDGNHFSMDIAAANSFEGKNGMAIAGNKDYSYVGNNENNGAPPEGVLDKNFKNNADEINKAEDKTATDGSLHKAGDVPNTDDNGGTFKGGEVMKDDNDNDLVQGGFDEDGNFVQSADGKDPETGEPLSNFGVYAASVDENGKLTAKDDNGNDLAQGGFDKDGNFVQAANERDAADKGLSGFGVHAVRDDGNGGLQAVDANGNDIVQGGFDKNGNFVQAANEKDAANKGLSDFGMHSVNADGQAVDANGNAIVQGGFDANGNFVQAANEKDAADKGLNNFGKYAQKEDGQVADANGNQVAQGGFDANGNFVQAANEKEATDKGLNGFGVHAVSKDANGGLQAVDANGNNIVQGGFNDKGEFVAAANKADADKQGLNNFGMHAVSQGGFDKDGNFVKSVDGKAPGTGEQLSNFGTHAVESNGKGGLKAAGPDSTPATSAANLNISSNPTNASIGNGITKDAAGNNFQDKNGNYVASSGGRLLSGAEQTNAHYGFAPGNSSQMERAVQNSDGKWVGATSGKELSGVIAAGGQGGAGSISINPASAPNGNGINPMAIDSNGKVSAATYNAKSGNWTTNEGKNVVPASNVFAAAPGEMPKNGSQLVYSSGNGQFEAVTPTGNGQFKTQSGQTVSASQVSAVSLGSGQAFCATDSNGKLQQVTQNGSGVYTFADGTKVTGPMQVGNETSKGNYQAASASTVAITSAPIATASGSGAQYSHGGATVFANKDGGYSSSSLSDRTNYTSTQGSPTMYSPITGNALTYDAKTNTFSNGSEKFAADAPLSTVGRGSICEIGQGSGAGNVVYFQNDRNEGDAINCGGKMMSASTAIATKDGISVVSADGTTTSVGSTAQECYSNVPMRSITTSDGNSYDNVTPVRDSGGKITSYTASDNGHNISISLDNIAGGSVAMYETQYGASGAKITLDDTRIIGGETYHNIAGTDSYIANSDLARTGNIIDNYNNAPNSGSVNIGGHAVDAACTRYDENGQINASGGFYKDQNTGVLFQSDEAPTVRTEPIRIPIDESKISKGFIMCDADNATHVTTNGKVYEVENGQMVVGNSNGTKQYAPIADGAVYGSVCPQYNGIPCDNGCLVIPPTASVTSGDGGMSANIDFNGQRITVNAPGAIASGSNTVQSGNSTITFSSPVYDKCENYFESNNIPVSKRFNDHEAQHIAGICHIPNAQNVKSLTRTSDGIVCFYNNNTAKRFYKTHTVDSVMKLDKDGNRQHTIINKQHNTDPLSLVKVCPEGFR